MMRMESSVVEPSPRIHSMDRSGNATRLLALDGRELPLAHAAQAQDR
jgi:hypothetical protein